MTHREKVCVGLHFFLSHNSSCEYLSFCLTCVKKKNAAQLVSQSLHNFLSHARTRTHTQTDTHLDQEQRLNSFNVNAFFISWDLISLKSESLKEA